MCEGVGQTLLSVRKGSARERRNYLLLSRLGCLTGTGKSACPTARCAWVCYDFHPMQTGIIGLPQVGKTTLFKILTRAKLDEKATRAATHVGVARVPEPRLEQLAKLYNPKKITYATVEYVDVGGMVKDRAKDSAVLALLR